MSDEQTPDVTVDAPADAADATPRPDPAETQSFARGKGRRGKPRAAGSIAGVGPPAAEAEDGADDGVVVVGPTGTAGEPGLVSAEPDDPATRSDEAVVAEPVATDVTDPGLFDPAEVADAPRAPHPLKPVVEALIFASPEPLTVKAMARLLEEHTKDDIEAAVLEVRETYQRSDGLQLVEVAGGFQIVTRPELYEWVRRLFKERTTSKLSVQALETLAVIAYKQPVTSGEIAEIRGVSATTGVLNTLLDRKLVKIVGRKQVVGRPFMYGTTREFLDKFGLKDLTDLPKVEDMSEALGFDLPSPVDPDGVSLPFDGAAEPLLFDDSDAPPSTASETAAVASGLADTSDGAAAAVVDDDPEETEAPPADADRPSSDDPPQPDELEEPAVPGTPDEDR